jgi:hypothetical protein
MGKLSFEVPHKLPKEQARQRVEGLLKHWVTKFGVTYQWNGDEAKVSGKVMGISLDAALKVLDGKVSGEGTDPGLLLRGQAKKYVSQKLEETLDPNSKYA